MFNVKIVYLIYPKTKLKRAVSAQIAYTLLSGIHSDKDPCHNRIGNWPNKNIKTCWRKRSTIKGQISTDIWIFWWTCSSRKKWNYWLIVWAIKVLCELFMSAFLLSPLHSVCNIWKSFHMEKWNTPYMMFSFYFAYKRSIPYWYVFTTASHPHWRWHQASERHNMRSGGSCWDLMFVNVKDHVKIEILFAMSSKCATRSYQIIQFSARFFIHCIK